MGDVYSEREAQAAVGEIARMMLALVERLEEIAEGLHEPADAEAMYDGRKPYSVAVDLRGAIECSVSDDLRPAVQRLERATSATAESLQRDFEERRG
jgi:hypothetical protein